MTTAEDRAGDRPRNEKASRRVSSPVSAAEARAEVEADRAARAEAHAATIAAAFPGPTPGRPTMWASWAATLALGVVSALALIDADAYLGAFFIVCFVLFLAGLALFALDIVLAAARSTTDLMGIGGLFFLAGSAPRSPRISLNASLVVAIGISVTATVVRLSTPELAFSILVPTIQLSLTGFWGVRHGHFAPRDAGGVRSV